MTSPDQLQAEMAWNTWRLRHGSADVVHDRAVFLAGWDAARRKPVAGVGEGE